jgi:rsbT co-antagonist protein RsbR
MSSDEQQLSGDLMDELVSVLMALADVAAGDYEARVTSRFDADHPLAALSQGVNELASSLQTEKTRSAAYQRELEDTLQVIEAQSRAIRELSTPVIEVWDGILCLPIVGVLDSVRSSELSEALLSNVVEKHARCVIIDITGIDAMDTHTADYFVRMARAVRLLGARCLVTGVNPHIAGTVVGMGLDFADVETRRTVRSALQDFVKARS